MSGSIYVTARQNAVKVCEVIAAYQNVVSSVEFYNQLDFGGVKEIYPNAK